MDYKKINNYLGWLVFIIATAVYFMTLEDTVSLWDCGEYITAAYKLEVGHPPGAPLFMVLGRLFSFFADPENVAVWINRLSALSSSATILFMFWSLTLLTKKIALRDKRTLSAGDKIAIFGSAVIGSLAYTFSDSFWFSAVEGEVYAMSSLFTAIIFWAILKWDEEMMQVKYGQLMPKGYSPDRWLLFIMFMLGLAIGVHLLGILVIPAITFMIYFRYKDKPTPVGIVLVGFLAIFILGFIQEGVITGSIGMAASMEVGFVRSLGMPFYSGTIFFFLMLIVIFAALLRYAKKKGRKIMFSAVMGLVLLMIGYGSFAVIVIRSNANTPLDENDPENLVTLYSYLKREQYGSAPLLSGPFWNSQENDRSLYKDQRAIYLRRHVVSKGDKVLKAFKDEKRANDYAKSFPGSTVEETYYESNPGDFREKSLPTYSQTTFLPRMYWSQDPARIASYKEWSGYNANDGTGTELGRDGKRLPTSAENFKFLFDYQINWMYWRYFMWNFAGRQNDIQGNDGGAMRGNWKSGIGIVDNARIGDQSVAPFYTTENPANNSYFFIPLILGLIGLFFHFYRAPKDAFVVLLAFLFTGIAIVLYLNQKPMEPRERDYAFAGSFYFFAFWIGIGAYALYDAFKSFGAKEFKGIGIIVGVGLIVIGVGFSMQSALSWLIVTGVAAGLIGLMVAIKKALKDEKQGAVAATVLTLIVPVLMGYQGWDDHDRSNKTSAHDLAYNYMYSVTNNGIIFTNGDNDTFPLWYLQEVENKRTDVRVCNLSLMQTDWYTEQMTMKAYDSDPLPIKFTEDQILMNAGSTDQVLFSGLLDLFYAGGGTEQIKKIVELRAKANPVELERALIRLSMTAPKLLDGVQGKSPQAKKRVNSIRKIFMADAKNDPAAGAFKKMQAGYELLNAVSSGVVSTDQETFTALRKALTDFENAWNMTNLNEAMEFVRDDTNMIPFDNGRRYLRVFPSRGFVYPINKDNAIKSGIVSEDQRDEMLDQIKFKFPESTRGLTREEVMMMDIIANNNWERGIFFSSAGGSDLSMALLRGWSQRGYDGHIKQNGMAFELSPLNHREGSLNRERMYQNMMKNYHYGEMQNPNVLTDYYARRHTVQYRSNFMRLAEDYVTAAIRAEDFVKNPQYYSMMDSTQQEALKLSKDEIATYKKRAISLIKKSLEVMPADVVIDYGEPRANSQLRYEYMGDQLISYSDGVLHDYVGILFSAGDKKAANELGQTVADQLESIINYYAKADVGIAARLKNTDDLLAAMEAYLTMNEASMDPELGDPKGKLAVRTTQYIRTMFDDLLPSMMDRLEQLANENGESTRRGSNAGTYANMLFSLQDYVAAIAIKHGLMDAPAPKKPQPTGPTPGGALPTGGNPMPAPPTGAPNGN